MFRILWIIAILFSLLVNQGWTQTQKISIAVVDLEASGITFTEAKALTNRLRSELVNIGTFDVMERDKMSAILQEQGFQQTECVSTECIADVGKLIGVKHIVGGSIGKLGTKYLLNVQLINVETGKILATGTEECICPLEELTSAIDKIAIKLSSGEAKTDEKPVLPEKKNGSGEKLNKVVKWISLGGAIAFGVIFAIVS